MGRRGKRCDGRRGQDFRIGPGGGEASGSACGRQRAGRPGTEKPDGFWTDAQYGEFIAARIALVGVVVVGVAASGAEVRHRAGFSQAPESRRVLATEVKGKRCGAAKSFRARRGHERPRERRAGGRNGLDGRDGPIHERDVGACARFKHRRDADPDVCGLDACRVAGSSCRMIWSTRRQLRKSPFA